MIDKFSKQQFEDNLFKIHPDFASLGIMQGEETYTIPVNSHMRLTIRSSIDQSGYAVESGQDSIRLWLEIYNEKWQPISRKVDAYTTRIDGWESRLESKIRTLWKRASTIRQAPTPCPKCQKVTSVNISKTAKNPDRPFQSCRKCNFFEWLDKESSGQMNFLPSVTPTPPTESYFDFENSVTEPPKPQRLEFTPSPYQAAIFDWVANGTGHGICIACAGSGKTTTNIEALNYLPKNISAKFLAFNRHIANELISNGVTVADTFHSLGKANIIRAMPQTKFNQWKIYNACDTVEVGLSYDEKAQIAKIIGLLKGNLSEPTKENAIAMIDNFPSIGLIDEDQKPFVARLAIRVFEHCQTNKKEYDFDDMIYLPATKEVPCEKFNFIFVDEAQDLNKAQFEFAINSLAENDRMLLIGDPNQAIYQFRGAYQGIMEYMQSRLNAIELPLSISYRCPTVIVEQVNREFPHIQFEAFEHAKEGSINTISMDTFLGNVQAGDGIICRTNAPLVKPCFQLIKDGKKATILGRNIGQGLVSLVKKRTLIRVKKLSQDEQLPALISELYVYLANEKPKLAKAKRFTAITLLEDQIETIIAISDGCQTISSLNKKINNTFSDKKEGIIFSSIHKAKGLEWSKVFILRPDLLPHPMAKSDSEKLAEKNLKYVAITRTKNELYFVSKGV